MGMWGEFVPFFSIIVPVYRVEKYIKKCIESVLAQSLGDFELILADDESPDKCPEICDEYAHGDSRIKVIHRKNGGASAARNSGIDAASGKYIIFLDADDYWESEFALERLAEKAKSEYDIIMFGCKLLNTNTGETRISRSDYNTALLESGSKNEALQYLLKNKKIPGAAWLFAMKRSLLCKNGIRFKTGISGEDYDFVLSCFFAACSFSAIDDTFYIYRRGRSESATGSAAEKIIDGSIYAVQKWRKSAENEACKPLAAELLNYLAFIYCTALLMAGGLKGKARSNAVAKLKNESDILPCGYWKSVKCVNAAQKIIGAGATAKLLNTYWKIFGK